MLTTCPRCDYSLKGLPADHACPECGLIYDAASELFLRSYSRMLVIAKVATPFLFAVGAILQWLSKPTVAGFIALAAVLALIVVLAGRMYRVYHRGPLLAITRDGLFVRVEDVEDSFIPWHKIADIVPHPDRQIATVTLRDPKHVFSIEGHFRGIGEMNGFIAKVNARRAASRSC